MRCLGEQHQNDLRVIGDFLLLRGAGEQAHLLLQDLEGLVTHGVLTRAEADGLKVCVLAAPNESWLSRLGEAADLRDRGLITPEEFGQLKASLITQLRTAAA